MQISERISDFNENGSNLTIDMALSFIIWTAGYRPLSASRDSPLPDFIQRKKACINLKNYDNKCFLYAVLLALNLDRVNISRCIKNPKMLLNMTHKVNFSGIK